MQTHNTHTHMRAHTHTHTHTPVHTHIHVHTHMPGHAHSLKHPQERDGKSTAVHAKILAPDDITMYIHPDLPTYPDTSKLLLLFPKKVHVHATLKSIYTEPCYSLCIHLLVSLLLKVGMFVFIGCSHYYWSCSEAYRFFPGNSLCFQPIRSLLWFKPMEWARKASCHRLYLEPNQPYSKSML